MRELKFRAWHKKTKEMKKECHVWKTINTHLFIETYTLNNSIKELQKNLVIMQFTGLYDKNEKPIYEGDITKTDTGVIGKVIFNYGKFLCRGRLMCWDLVFNASYGKPQNEKIMRCEDMEIIGNIYETPKLLKEIK